jgi:hypothetical protein
MGKAKPVSLHPLTFHEALKALVKVDPDKVGLVPKRRKKKTQANRQKLSVELAKLPTKTELK